MLGYFCLSVTHGFSKQLDSFVLNVRVVYLADVIASDPGHRVWVQQLANWVSFVFQRRPIYIGSVLILHAHIFLYLGFLGSKRTCWHWQVVFMARTKTVGLTIEVRLLRVNHLRLVVLLDVQRLFFKVPLQSSLQTEAFRSLRNNWFFMLQGSLLFRLSSAAWW